MRNRYGNLITGKSFYLTNDFSTRSAYDGSGLSASSLTPLAPKTDVDFEYTQNDGGVWGISCTEEFTKRNNRTVASGLTYEIDAQYIIPEFYVWNTRTIDIARYANRSARVVFRVVLRGGISNPASENVFIDTVNVSGTIYGFEVSGESWQTTTVNTYLTPYESLAWTTIASTATRNRFSRANVDIQVGSSGNGYFGIQTNYIASYSEHVNHTMWMRSPVLNLGATPTLSYRYFKGFSGTFQEAIIFTYLDLQ